MLGNLKKAGLYRKSDKITSRFPEFPHDMTFHCRNYDINRDRCRRLRGECVPGRRGCVLEGRVAVSEELAEKIRSLDETLSEWLSRNDEEAYRDL